MIRRVISIVSSSALLLALPLLVRAQIIPVGCSDSSEASPCGLDQFAQVFVNLYNLGVQYVGAVTLLFFVIGGFLLLTSAGRSDQIEWGKRTLIGATIGLFIILFSFVLVRFIQDDILQSYDQFILTDDNQCTGKDNGTPCELNGQNVFTCQSGVCSTRTLCEEQTGGTKNCTTRTFCDQGTIVENLCPGDRFIVCCTPKDAPVQRTGCSVQFPGKKCVDNDLYCQDGTKSFGSQLCPSISDVCCVPYEPAGGCSQQYPSHECLPSYDCLNNSEVGGSDLCANPSDVCCLRARP